MARFPRRLAHEAPAGCSCDLQMVVDMEVYSPYRVYMHNVLPQVCGSPAVISAILTAVLERLAARGFLPADVKVVLPMMGGAEGLPFAQVRRTPSRVSRALSCSALGVAGSLCKQRRDVCRRAGAPL